MDLYVKICVFLNTSVITEGPDKCGRLKKNTVNLVVVSIPITFFSNVHSVAKIYSYGMIFA